MKKNLKNTMCYSFSNSFIWVWLLFTSLATSALVSYCHGGVLPPITGVLPVFFREDTNMFLVKVEQGSYQDYLQSATKYLTLDLSGRNLWTSHCNESQRVSCNSPVCNMSAACNIYACSGKSCTDNNTTCSVIVTDPFTAQTMNAELWQGNLSLPRTDTDKPMFLPDFPFACAPAGGEVSGVLGVSRAYIAVPQALSRSFSFPPIFTYCLSTYGYNKSPLFFGGPEDRQSIKYSFRYNIEILADAFHFTPLITSRNVPDEYFVQINSISVGGALLPINTSLLTIGEQSGRGGSRISTTERYTRLEPSIYQAISQAFVEKAVQFGLREVAPVPPFETCFDMSRVLMDRIGQHVPSIVLGFSNTNASELEANWEMDALNSMVPVYTTFSIGCLAFLETKPEEKASIVIGTFQQEDLLMRFDLKSNQLGFTQNIIRGHRTRCSNFDFTTPT